MAMHISRLSLLLLMPVFVLAGGADMGSLLLYILIGKIRVMEQAILQINAYLDGDRNARIECDDEGELYRLFHTVNSLAASLKCSRR